MWSVSRDISISVSELTKIRQAFNDLFDLPLEIRNMVYWNALVAPHLTEQTKGWRPWQQVHGLKQPALAMVSRAIRAESLEAFYGGNEFRLSANIDRCLQISEVAAPRAARRGSEEGLDLGHQVVAGSGLKSIVVSPGWYSYEGWGFQMATACRDSSRADGEKVGDEALDWTDKGAVELAYLGALRRTVTRTPGSNRVRLWSSRHGPRSMGSLLWWIAQECPQLRAWVYLA